MDLVKINASDYGLEEKKAQQIEEQFKPMLAMMTDLEKEYNEVVKLDITESETSVKAKELRLKYVKVRTGTAEIHKAQKAFYLAGGRFVDGWKNTQKFASEGIEKNLMLIETHFENIEKERLENLQIKRVLLLSQYIEDAHERDLSGMDEDVWNAYISTKEKEYKDKKKAEKKAEEEKIRIEKEEAAEHERIRKENIKLRKEREEKAKQNEIDKKERERLEKTKEEKRATAEKQRLAIQEKERKLREDQERKQQEIYEANLRKEREEKAKLEAQIKAKKEAEEQAKEAELLRVQNELNKGDQDKVNDLIKDLSVLKTKYIFKSQKNNKMYSDVGILIDKVINIINTN